MSSFLGAGDRPHIEARTARKGEEAAQRALSLAGLPGPPRPLHSPAHSCSGRTVS
ncbi:uncharacterized protein SCHCODRAFT_02132389 [Schizophyllum commune H4-8]|uniref:uncharacterized protein n=1 Tax=Schizophyllum commune (strain H4-8 / FGSC 9210) TaxID=578458 RepID=UPI002160BAA0|nr:uncharacterized protein SCHCODRAFT_02132389 [Schizophyllum commune H4-8]KAI5885153.1 hypothetical protein SCHCODRAFT_02132389 [Schizophyllum commune H4-8]